MGLQKLYRFRGLVKIAVLFSISILSFSSFADPATDSVEAPIEKEITQSKGSGQYPTDEAALEEGLSLFEGNCTACHAMNKIVVGPALEIAPQRGVGDGLSEAQIVF